MNTSLKNKASDKMEQDWCVYMILCTDQSLYTGISNDVERRFQQHSNNKGAKYFRSHKPLKIVYLEDSHTRTTASQREYQIKQLSPKHKKALVESEHNQLHTTIDEVNMSHKKEIQVRKIMHKIEHKIPEMNSKAISEIAGDIYQTDFELLAESIAIMRAQYLKKVVDLARKNQTQLNTKDFDEVREYKLAFEEAISNFDHLKRALQRGHFDLADEQALEENEDSEEKPLDDSES